MVPAIGSSASRSSKRAHALAARRRPGRRSARPRTGRAGTVIRPNSSAVMNTFGLRGREDVARVPCGRRSARSAPPPRRGTPTPRTTTAASIQFGSWNATTSPGPTPRSRRPAASRRACSSTSAKVPANGRTAECTQKPASGLAAGRRATRSPSVSGRPPPLVLVPFGQLQPGCFDRIAAPPHLRFGCGDAILR